MLSNRVKIGQSSVRCSQSLKEPENERLQREVELTIRKLEYEKRESTSLDEQIKIVETELNEAKRKTKLPEISSEKPLKAQISALEKQLNLEISQLNNANISNKEIKDTIESHRMELQIYHQNLTSLADEVELYSQKSTQLYAEYEKGAVEIGNHQKKIEIIRSKSAKTREMFSDKVTSLVSIINKEKSSVYKSNKDLDSFFATQVDRSNDVVDITKILTIFVSKWRKAVNSKKRDLENYKRHIKAIDSLFIQIKNATGLDNFDEIVTTFVKSEEQNYEVYKYINELNSEIDNLEDSFKRTTQRIRSLEENKETSEKDGSEMFDNLSCKIKNLKANSVRKQEKSVEVQRSLDSLLPLLSVNLI